MIVHFTQKEIEKILMDHCADWSGPDETTSIEMFDQGELVKSGISATVEIRKVDNS